MRIKITNDEDTINGRVISMGDRKFTFPLDISNEDIIKNIKNILKPELSLQRDYDNLDRSKIKRLIDKEIEVI